MIYKSRSNKLAKTCLLLFRQGTTFFVVDCETTGRDYKTDYIIELSALKYNLVNGEPVLADELDLYMKPPFLIEEDVIKIHNITNEFLADKPDESELFPIIDKFFGENIIFVGYNGEFDFNFINALYKRQGREFKIQINLDVLDMARDIVGDDAPNHKLQTISEHYGLSSDITFHRAIDDIKATARLLFVFYEEYKKKESFFNVPKDRLIINAAWFWDGFKKEQKGIYFNTNVGKIWFCTYNKTWCSSEVDLSKYDLDEVENYLSNKTGLTFKDFAKLTKRTFGNLQMEGKI